MKKVNILIITLLVVGICGLALVEGYIRPEMRRREQQYLSEQRDPLTHDFSRLLEFRSRYMGDASNLGNLNANLPLGEIRRTFQFNPKTLTAEINYQDALTGIEAELFDRALVYNATANFVLIDNLETLILNFEQDSYTISRRTVESWYGVDLASMQNEARWAEKVQRPLSDRAYVRSFIEENFTMQPRPA
jgi:hypothetical protein